MTAPSEAWRTLWAKTERGGDRWHRLPYHLLDVAATAETLWESLPNAAKRVPLALSNDPDECRRIVVFLAAAHDVGKANPFFQHKDARRAAALDLSDPGRELEGHGYATGVFLKAWLKEHWRWGGMAAANVARAVGGHHGSFFTDTKESPLGLKEEPWRSFGPRLLDDLADVLDVRAGVTEPADLNSFLGWIAGFVCVADWLGSHKTMTVWERGDPPLADYLDAARAQARQLFDQIGWDAPDPIPARSIAELVPKGRAPNELQRLAERVAAEGFGFAIVEAPTGEGKTEAAFALAEPERAAGGGVAFFLPTMATANGILGRVKGFIADDVRLAHSQAWLFPDADRLEPNPGDEESAPEAEDWLAGSKRTLLAPYTVGTIDQGLLGALRVRHGFVRLFALAGKTVVVDEVHAYDVYMSDLLEVLLGWLRALGCRVILLSATLPAARRAALFRAWGAAPDEAADYPCLTWVGADGAVRAEGFDVAPRKPLALRLVERGKGEAWAQGAACILRRVKEKGGTGALVLNTVAGAQRAYDWLRASAEGEGIDVLIFHARYTAEDRRRKEDEVLARFGKDGPRERPTILVATQVVEQSLDLDFDHMVSALAPVDLLIQRAGRLHRHRRHQDGSLCEGDEPDERLDPVLEIIAPQHENGVPSFDDPVYEPDLLVLTTRFLEGTVTLKRPMDVAQAVEAVYDEELRASIIYAQEDKIARFGERARDKAKASHRKASEAAIAAWDDEDRLFTQNFLDQNENDERFESQVRARTRLEDRPSISVAVLDQSSMELTGWKIDPREVAFRSLSASPPYDLYASVSEIDLVPSWGRWASLKRTRPLNLSAGQAVVGEYTLKYDDLGLSWRKKDDANVPS